MTPKDILTTFYTEPEEDGSFAIVVAKTLSEACQALAEQLEAENGYPVDPSTLTLTRINPSKPKVLTFTPSSEKFDKPRFL